ncbi:RRM domain-containing protein [Mycena venus]|uniref:RRM domain-containing protein n=1 Tax=Mycena venus TaxID=2733690 RepID=A0A8H7D620_9AGAR|nr:RRM domain-containing protein [Mycena venus]
MAVSTPASSPTLEENPAKPPLATDDSDLADFLGIPASESLTSTASQYHSALNSPIPCETSEPLASEEQSHGTDLISFSSGKIASVSTPSKPFASPSSSPSVIPSNEPKSPEFSSNRHRLAPLRRPQLSVDTNESGKTSNVYINGLPANFRDDQLYAIAAPFGEVLSVRCFTRNTAKNPSGYGFVLFKTVGAAEKCIVTLKRSDLHPSFSKVNKPPRIVCSPNSPSLPARSSSSSLSSSNQESPLPGSPELNFKAKMAQLEDRTSPNVYIEGLPLSADKNTLIELVYPYAIQTFLFVPLEHTLIFCLFRMENRAAAEDVILRLNGKMVRGWDGTENRVYLRIADTLDQRELRRSEASAREDNPGRLTIAQATLLNYHGAKDLQADCDLDLNKPAELRLLPNVNPNPLPATVHGLLTGYPGAARRPLPMNQNQCIPVPETHLPHPLAANIHNLLAVNAANNSTAQNLFRPTPTAFPLQDPLYAPYTTCPAPLAPVPPVTMHPNVTALFESLAAMQRQQHLMRMSLPVFPPPPAMAGFPNQFNTNANANVKSFVTVQNGKQPNGNIGPGGFLRVPAETVVMQARAELQSARTNSNPMVNVAPGLTNNGNIHPAPGLMAYRRPLPPVPPQFFSPPVTAQKLPLAPRQAHVSSPLRSNPTLAPQNPVQTHAAFRAAPPPSFNPLSSAVNTAPFPPPPPVGHSTGETRPQPLDRHPTKHQESQS